MKCEVVKLSDVCDLIAGFAFKSKDFGDFEDKVIKIADIVPPRVDMKGLRGVNLSNYNKDKLEKFIAKPGDYVLAMTGATIGKIGRIYEKSAYINQRVLLFRPHKEIDKDFLYYTICAKSFYDYIISFVDSETAQPNISATTIGKYELYLPDLNTQKKIASILQSLDDKIELNNKINENLEQQARALLMQWLVENDGSYEFSLLSEVAVINPDTYSPKDAWEFVNYLDTSSITNGIISEVQHIKPSREKLPSRARRIIAPNDVVFSTVRPNQRHFGLINDPLDNMLASTGFAVVRSNHPFVSNELLYLCLTEDSFIEKMQQLAEQSTSTFPSIKPSDLGCCEVPCPISTDLAEILKAVFVRISNNQKENRVLSELRDTLLPKLMNGEIDVDGI